MELTEGIITSAVGMISVLTNGVLLLVLLKDPIKCFQASRTCFIMNLAVADLLTGTNAFVWGLSGLHLITTGFKKCLSSLSGVTIHASFFTILAMSVERFLIVRYPFKSRMWFTKGRVHFCVAFIWVISAILGGLTLIPFPIDFYVHFAIALVLFILILVIAGFYAFLLLRMKDLRQSLQGRMQLENGDAYRMHNDNPKKVSIQRETDCPKSVTTKIRLAVGNSDKILHSSFAQTTTENVPTSSKDEEIIMIFREENSCHSNEKRKQDVAVVSKADTGTAELEGSSSNLCKKPSEVAHLIVTRREKTKRNEQEAKLTAVVLLLVVVTVLTVLPYLLALQIHIGRIIFCKYPPFPGVVKFMDIYLPIEVLNFAVNLLIYAWRLPQYRRKLKHLIFCG